MGLGRWSGVSGTKPGSAPQPHPPVTPDPAEPCERVPVDIEGPAVGSSCKLHVVATVVQLGIQLGVQLGLL